MSKGQFCFIYFLLMFLVFFVTSSMANEGHHCIFDKINTNTDTLPIAVTLEIPQRNQKGWHVYTTATDIWKPIRIKAFTIDLDNKEKFCSERGQLVSSLGGEMIVCEEGHILTAAKKSILSTYILPAAINLHEERLLVRPLVNPLRLPNKQFNVYCGKFSIPPEHFSAGVSDADTLLYVAAAPTEGSNQAWSNACSQLSSGRPTHGVMNFGPQFIEMSRHSVRVAAHEIAHVLGFSYRHMVIARMLSKKDLRGKTDVILVSSPKTLENARSHYNCSDISGMELEDEGLREVTNSHWERRNAKDELMATNPGLALYTALTLSVFEDLGYYEVQWDKAETMTWGNASGCDFLNEACIKDDKPLFDVFCTKVTDLPSCTSDRLGLGYCSMHTYEDPVKPPYTYFSNQFQSGVSETLTDMCPIITPLSTSSCTHGDQSKMPGSRIGSTSRCVKGNSLHVGEQPVGDVCVQVSCEQGQVSLRYQLDDLWHQCPEGQRLKVTGVFSRGEIICPRHDEVCPGLIGEIRELIIPNYTSQHSASGEKDKSGSDGANVKKSGNENVVDRVTENVIENGFQVKNHAIPNRSESSVEKHQGKDETMKDTALALSQAIFLLVFLAFFFADIH